MADVASSDLTERTIGDLTLRIDRSLCVGFAQCIDESELAFVMPDEDDVVSFNRPEDETRDRLLQACRACPVEALVVLDAEGNQQVP
ncbi:ferredoxin [Kribbella sp. NPDC049227]|uniref:ferredoxin n=1 Tax=Kribbella sp. NPDC049227 TaxID=3364113 RepID=UPI00371B3DEB